MKYIPVHCTRSDGKGYDYGTGIDSDSNTKACEDTSVDERWRIHLGGYLKTQLASGGHLKNDYVLDELPAGYVLRLTNASSDKSKDKKQDYAIFGHPFGRKCRYRTSGEFVPHLLWLLSDSQYYSDCSCEWCPKYVKENPSLARPSKTATNNTQAPATSPEPGPSRQAKTPITPTSITPASTAVDKSTPESSYSASPSVPARVPTNASTSTPGTNPVAPIASTTPIPPPLAAPEPYIPFFASPPGTTGPSNLFRLGEMAWYQQGPAWRLGLILQIGVREQGARPNGEDSAFSFCLAPLGHMIFPQNVQIKSAAEMQPFLTFSVPDTTNPEIAGKRFTEIDWPNFAARYCQDAQPDQADKKKQLLGLEASKTAARHVNDSFSTFNRLSHVPGSANTGQYSGAFLGAEMIHVGDAIRVLVQNQEAVIMHVREIHVRAQMDGRDMIFFRGTIVRLACAHEGQAFNVQAENLGPPFVEELLFRRQLESQPRLTWGWHALGDYEVSGENQVQGRYYVTNRLRKYVAAQKFQESLQQGRFEDQSSVLNSRYHAEKFPDKTWRPPRLALLPTRRLTFGPSVSAEIRLPKDVVEAPGPA